MEAAFFCRSQWEVVREVLRGRDQLVVMATGSGKSVCYQLPAVARQGLAVVISPLISLMEDQVMNLKYDPLNERGEVYYECITSMT